MPVKDKLPDAHSGIDLAINNSPVEFSFWPTKNVKEKEKNELQFEIFSKEAWSVIEGEIDKRCPTKSLSHANAFLAQAKDFYVAVSGSGVISNPLLYYYSFLNLVKAQLITEGNTLLTKKGGHGLVIGEDIMGDLNYASLKVKWSSPNMPSVFNELLTPLEVDFIKNESERIFIDELLPTVVAGHRLWKDSGDYRERFIPIHKIKFTHSKEESKIWLNISILKQDIARFNFDSQMVLAKSGISDKFKEVKSEVDDKGYENDKIICFEQKTPITYDKESPGKVDSAILDNIDSLINTLCLREKFWQVATSIPPYRKYYLYLRPEGELQLAQLPALYGLFFYFGSVTRYSPSAFDKIRNSGKYRAFISDFFASQPEQFLNLFASEFCKRKVVKPAIP